MTCCEIEFYLKPRIELILSFFFISNMFVVNVYIYKKDMFVFSVKTEERTLLLYTDNELDRIEWIKAIEECSKSPMPKSDDNKDDDEAKELQMKNDAAFEAISRQTFVKPPEVSKSLLYYYVRM